MHYAMLVKYLQICCLGSNSKGMDGNHPVNFLEEVRQWKVFEVLFTQCGFEAQLTGEGFEENPATLDADNKRLFLVSFHEMDFYLDLFWSIQIRGCQILKADIRGCQCDADLRDQVFPLFDASFNFWW